MPRKYQPPAAKRRKRKSVTYQFDHAPEDGAAPPDVPAEEAAADISVQPGEGEAVAPPLHQRTTAKHITRDYSYVRSEIVRILVLAGFLLTSLVITAILRN